MKKILVALAVLFALIAIPSQAQADNVYWKEQCNGVITWSSTGGRKQIVRSTMIILDAAMPHYTFKEVSSSNTSANIQIRMNAGPSEDYYGLTWVFLLGDNSMLGADIEIFANKDRTLIAKVLLHELFHAVGFDHIDHRPSLMNTYFNSNGPYKADWIALRNKDALCS